MDFLEKLNYLMSKQHLNKNTLSKACDIPYTTIDGWYKKGYEGLKLTTLRKLAKFFNTTLDYWANDDNENIDNKPLSINQELCKLNMNETTVIMAYRNRPEMQLAVDTLLGIDKMQEVEKTVGKSIGDTTKLEVSAELTPVNEKLEQQVEEYRQSLLDEAKGETLSAYYETDLNELGTIRKKAN